MGGGGGKLDTDVVETRTMIPVHRLSQWQGTITGIRIGFANAGPAQVVIKSFHTACDTRHNINNSNFIRGCCDYVAWTGDLDFLRHAIGRMRRALTYALDEFRVREGKHVFVPWVGHDGRSGIALGPNGQKAPRLGLGVGNNYWDLLPFGGHDALATIYLYDALGSMATLEESIANQLAAIPSLGAAIAMKYIESLPAIDASAVLDVIAKQTVARPPGGSAHLDEQLHAADWTRLALATRRPHVGSALMHAVQEVGGIEDLPVPDRGDVARDA